MRYLFFLAFSLYLSAGYGAIVCGGHSVWTNSQAFGDFIVPETGRFDASDSRFLGLQVEGKVELVRSVVQGECTITGMVKAEQTQFEKKIDISSGRLILDHCTLPSLYVKDGHDTLITVELKSGTVINGSIYFENGTGCVFADPSVVIHGEVVGGALNTCD